MPATHIAAVSYICCIKVQVGLAIQAWRGLSLCLAATTGEYLLEDLLIAPLFGYKISHIVANKQPSQTAKQTINNIIPWLQSKVTVSLGS
jgi:hypothetical protein